NARRTQASFPLNHQPAVAIGPIQHEDRTIELIDLRPEGLLEIIGEDLMLGADQARIVERLSAHGIPVTPDLLAQVDQLATTPAIQAGQRLALKLRKRNWLLGTLFRLADEA